MIKFDDLPEEQKTEMLLNRELMGKFYLIRSDLREDVLDEISRSRRRINGGFF